MTQLNKKYSRYDGTEVVRRVLCPSKSSKYMFKNSEVCRKRDNSPAVVHELRELLRTICDMKYSRNDGI